jgi:REP element-mobilizing transposase RayT
MKFYRRSIRLKEYDYSQSGAYFVTIVTFQRECMFGEIANSEMQLNGFGEITDECWRAIPEHFTNVELGAYVVMPNHVHGIIVIHDVDDGRGTIYRAPTVEKFGKPTTDSLPTIIRTYKAGVARRIRREWNAKNIWKRNYYERIIRNEREWDKIHWYIVSNPSSGRKMTKTQ